MKRIKQKIALVFLLIMLMGLTACGEEKEMAGSKYDTFVIGTQEFDGIFSPFFYSSAYDAQVNQLVFANVCRLNAEGELVDEAGHVEVEEVLSEDGTKKYVYTVTLREGMKFSDGEDVTIDDLIFTYYVYADPTYDGMSTFGTLDIEGMQEYVSTPEVNEIRGIQKVDEYTVKIIFNSPNISGDKQVAWLPIMPQHYYGVDFVKGDLSGVKELNKVPMGSGAYIFESYEDNIVSLKANENYFKGIPKIPNVKLQVVSEEDKVDLVLNGEIDVTDPAASLEILEQLEVNTETADYSLVDNPGYGYIGISAERVPDVNVRKGLMHLMNRAPAVATYYGELGEVIERPMTPTLPEYPEEAMEYYDYNPKKALEYFLAAGYEQIDGKLVKDGKQLVITVGIGDANMHPVTPILTQMANDLAAMGGQLTVSDLQFNVLSTEVKGGNLDMWVMAWGNATDCDQTQMFGSNGGSNYQRYYSKELDEILAKIKETLDFEERCKLVEQSLDMIMDAAIYMPVYQRKNMEIYNATTINLETLPKETTSFYNYTAEIETLEMQ